QVVSWLQFRRVLFRCRREPQAAGGRTLVNGDRFLIKAIGFREVATLLRQLRQVDQGVCDGKSVRYDCLIDGKRPFLCRLGGGQEIGRAQWGERGESAK